MSVLFARGKGVLSLASSGWDSGLLSAFAHPASPLVLMPSQPCLLPIPSAVLLFPSLEGRAGTASVTASCEFVPNNCSLTRKLSKGLRGGRFHSSAKSSFHSCEMGRKITGEGRGCGSVK